MRYQYFIHILTFAILFALDFIFQSFFTRLHLPHILFVSHFHFIALVLYAREDDRFEIMTKVLLVSFAMDLIHYRSFPVYYVAYGLSIFIIRFWHRHISDSYFEKMMIVALGIFIKETILFYMLQIHQNYDAGYFVYLSTRSFWVILGSVLFLWIPYNIVRISDKWVKSYSKKHYQ